MLNIRHFLRAVRSTTSSLRDQPGVTDDDRNVVEVIRGSPFYDESEIRFDETSGRSILPPKVGPLPP